MVYLPFTDSNGDPLPFLTKFTTEEAEFAETPVILAITVPSGAVFARVRAQDQTKKFNVYTTCSGATGAFIATDDGIIGVIDYELPVFGISKFYVEGLTEEKLSICWKY